MGQVKALWQAERDRLWQQHYDDYCRDHFGGRQAEGRDHDAACDYANEQLEEGDDR
jgi:hypothetical protein